MLSSAMEKGKVVVLGIDSGIVTTSSLRGSSLRLCLNPRLQVLNESPTHKEEEEKFAFTLTANKINEGALSVAHRRKRERLQHKD